MARRSGLGKGLSALIPNEVVGDRSSALREVPIGSIKPNPRQPRVNFDDDTMAGDVVDRGAVFENTQVHFNPEQKWYYLPNQLPSELLVFKNADSEEKDGSSLGELCCGETGDLTYI